jgi:hypothetical protein
LLKRRKSAATVRLAMRSVLVKFELKLILILKNFFWYCSFDQFLWAIGAFTEVNIYLFVGKKKKFTLFFAFRVFSTKAR